MKKLFSLAICLSLIVASPLILQAQRGESKGRMLPPLADQSPMVSSLTAFGPAFAYTDGNVTLVEWTMIAERENFGFSLQRLGDKGWETVSDTFTGGSALLHGSAVVPGEKYSTLVEYNAAGTIYRIESISTVGAITFSEPFTAVQVNELAGFSEFHNAETRKRARSQSGTTVINTPSLPKEVASEVESNSLTPNPDGHRWVVSQPGVRIGVRKDGFYRVTRTELEIAGFNVNADPALWHLYSEGNQQSLIVGPNGDYIEFYGRGIDTPESDNRGYFLVVGPSAGKRMATRVARPDGSTVRAASYQHRFEFKERINYTNQIRNGDAENFFGRPILRTLSATVPFNLSEIDTEAPSAQVSVRIQGFSAGLHSVSVRVNGQSVGTVEGAGQLNVVQTFSIPTAWLQQGANSVLLAAVAPGTEADTNLFDSLTVEFRRKHVIEGGKLDFYTLGNRGATLTGLSSANVRLIDTTFENDPIEVVGLNPIESNGNYSLQIPAARPKTYHAFEPSQVLSVADIRPIIADSLGTPAEGAQLVVIAHPSLMTEATQWAAYRQSQGISVKVVNVIDVFDEFGFGVLSSASIKSFLQYAELNWTVRPGYVLLVGDASYDSRDYTGAGKWNMVPTKIVNTIFSETGSDEYLADFNNDGLSEIAIGRIPARTTARVQNALEKVVRWEANLIDPLSRGALFAYDEPVGYDFQAMSERLRDRLPQSMTATFVGKPDVDSVASLISAMNNGPYVVNYAGHGSTGAWSGSPVWFSVFNVNCTNGATQCVSNVDNESLYLMLTCLNGYFVQTTSDSLAESLLFLEDRGAVASWASTGLTTADVQEIMGQRFYQKVTEGTIPRIGDLIVDAKSIIPGGTDVRLSWALFGDPMLRVR
ncbi:MAG: hypothetical protein IPM21_16100 [Acidobacteria bacterium]|nr:hypothetical protein [Acidobacteriota bacterium]